MWSLPDLLQQSTAHAYLFIPAAVLLGALHGLEPGHSKTMMAAFIIAVRGTVGQAVLLGLAAAISHTAVVWVVALGGQYLGREWGTEATEPYFQFVSAALIIGIALWMIWRTWREQNAEADDQHHHGDGIQRVDTGHGTLGVEIFEDGVPPRFRLRFERGERLKAQCIAGLETIRPDGSRQTFGFVDRGDYLESLQEIPEPHAFAARLKLDHLGHSHTYRVAFAEHAHDHDPSHMKLGDEDDAHARAHASDIRQRFEGRQVTTGQIVMFGLTGGLIPCPAAITVLLLCIQLKQISLGVVLVLCFSIGLAATMVTAGVAASLSVRHLSKRWSGFGIFARRGPYASGALMILIALYMGFSGWMGLQSA